MTTRVMITISIMIVSIVSMRILVKKKNAEFLGVGYFSLHDINSFPNERRRLHNK